MILSFVGMILGVLSGGSDIVYAQEPEPPAEIQIEVRIDWSESRILSEIENRAQEYGVSASELKRVIDCESNGSTTIQSNHRYTLKNAPQGYQVGDREESYGLVQFHIPAGNKTKDGRMITKEMAQDPAVAIDTMAYYFSLGQQKKWSCW